MPDKKYTYSVTLTPQDWYAIIYKAHFKNLPPEEQELVRSKDKAALDRLGKSVVDYIRQHPEYEEDKVTTITSATPLKGEEEK